MRQKTNITSEILNIIDNIPSKVDSGLTQIGRGVDSGLTSVGHRTNSSLSTTSYSTSGVSKIISDSTNEITESSLFNELSATSSWGLADVDVVLRTRNISTLDRKVDLPPEKIGGVSSSGFGGLDGLNEHTWLNPQHQSQCRLRGHGLWQGRQRDGLNERRWLKEWIDLPGRRNGKPGQRSLPHTNQWCLSGSSLTRPRGKDV